VKTRDAQGELLDHRILALSVGWIVGNRKAKLVGEILKSFCMMGGKDARMSTGGNLQVVLRSSIFVASCPAVSKSFSMSYILLSLLSLRLINLQLLY
jgi:hypothetical protein